MTQPLHCNHQCGTEESGRVPVQNTSSSGRLRPEVGARFSHYSWAAEWLRYGLIVLLMLFIAGWAPAWGQSGVAPTQGDGSSGNPFQIATLENLIWVREQTNGAGGTGWSAGKHFVQTADIDLISITNWTPIGIGDPGTSSAPANSFRGTYDGANLSIRNLKITGNSEYRGLFGYVWGATLKNIRIENASVSAGQRSGILLGSSNCFSCTGSPRTDIIQVSVTGSITSNSDRVGGIVGNPARNTFITGQNVFIGNVTATGDVGGLVGRASGDSALSFSYARANVTGTNVGSSAGVGILIGNASTGAGSFVEMYGQGTVTASGTQNKGVIGIAPSTTSGGNHKVTDIWFDSTGGLQLIGNSGTPSPTWVTITGGGGLTTAQMQGSSAAVSMTGDGSRWDFSNTGNWRAVTTPEDDYPVFTWQAGNVITISGKVTDAENTPLNGITVRAQVGDATFKDVHTE